MEGQTITISMELFMELMDTKAKVNAAQHYVNSDKYPEKKTICNIIGIKYPED